MAFGRLVELSRLNGRNGFEINGEAAEDGAGTVASAGDVNGDGFDDVTVGAVGADPNGADSGSSYVVFGRAGGFAADLDLSRLDGADGFRIDGEAAGDQSGYTVASAGDVNGDGLDDLIVGAPFAEPTEGFFSGATYVVFGRAGGFGAALDLAALDGENGFRISARDGSQFGAAAGDVNGDGIDDILIGAPIASPSGGLSGASYVVFGRTDGFGADFDLSVLNGRNGFRIDGERAGDQSGNNVAAGDLNGDGFDDVFIGAGGADPNGEASGASYVLFGRASGPIARTGTDGGDFLRGGRFDDALSGAGGADRLAGRAGDDTLDGAAGRDRLFGGHGDDELVGGPGRDGLSGGSGADALVGGRGADVLLGGAGADRFVFEAAADSPRFARDRIGDFERGADRIDLRAIDADPDEAGDQAFAFRGTDGFTGAGGEVRLRFADGQTSVLADLDGDRAADLRIALTGTVALTADDVLL